MLTNEDVKKIVDANKEIFVTKEDFTSFKSDLVGIFATKDDAREIKEELVSLREIVQGLAVNVDKFVKMIDDVRQEYIAIGAKTDRLEKWIHQIAGKTGVKLEY